MSRIKVDGQWVSRTGTIIFDNGGGITLQFKNYCHYYDDVAQAVNDFKQYLQDGNTNGWDGNEPEQKIIIDDNQIANGGYQIYSITDILHQKEETGWCNVDSFVNLL